MRTIALVNQKGGVGKTTTTTNLARVLARSGRRVLVVDDDEQGAATFHFLGDGGEDLATLQDVIGHHPSHSLGQIITATGIEGIDLVPANDDLAILANDLVVAGVGRESRLAEALATVATAYDTALVDCPPSLNLLTVNALTAADQALIVTEPELYSARGVGKLLDTIEAVTAKLNATLTVAGVLISKYNAAAAIHRERAEQIRAQLGRDPGVLTTVVPYWMTAMRTADAAAGAGDLATPAGRRLTAVYDAIAHHLDPTLPYPEATA